MQKKYFETGSIVKATLKNEAPYITGEVIWYGPEFLVLGNACKYFPIGDKFEAKIYETDVAIQVGSIKEVEFLNAKDKKAVN